MIRRPGDLSYNFFYYGLEGIIQSGVIVAYWLMRDF